MVLSLAVPLPICAECQRSAGSLFDLVLLRHYAYLPQKSKHIFF